MRKLVSSVAVMLAATSVAASAHASAVIDFDNLATSYGGGAYHEDGFVLTGNFCNSISGNCINAVDPALSIDGSGTSVVKASGAATTFTVAREDGGAFQFVSMDFGKTKVETGPVFTASSTYEFKFTLADADETVVTRYFTFDHNRNSPIVAHTAIFEGLGDITKFTFRNQSTAAQFDNIRLGDAAVAAVPEPATWAMMIGGFGMVGGVMRRRRENMLKLA
ncbi:PEPxxWA-CTERM sorting domain-containing protein [Edaphosphingomonas haloaromaticamans]|uniref:Ice-binding protein C-terminal domain-containing protein n=1 Tax=Edaphosphingomonas haloaromaticamans TaxID=653954 RepID=A0A1S1HHB9_9SPHN|nr:PEPxxWA-CTERM sorting domain-containing protein [Sphingomonas haloaromaticamans]OHT20846.1 hypothetical protein BHE75_02850 [Sphingomonas haloaromaticamans]